MIQSWIIFTEKGQPAVQPGLNAINDELRKILNEFNSLPAAIQIVLLKNDYFLLALEPSIEGEVKQMPVKMSAEGNLLEADWCEHQARQLEARQGELNNSSLIAQAHFQECEKNLTICQQEHFTAWVEQQKARNGARRNLNLVARLKNRALRIRQKQ